MPYHNQPARFEVSVETGAMAVRHALDKLMSRLEPLKLEIEESGTVELVIAEALNNVVEHGYPDPNEYGLIHILCSQEHNGLRFEIKDKGRPMPNGQPPFGFAPDVTVALDDLPEGGFGWFLIKDLARDVSYERQGNENHLTLRISVGLS